MSTSAPADIDSRRLVVVGAERVSHVSSTDFPGHYPGEDHSWDLHRFKTNMKVSVSRVSNRQIEFDLVGVDASVANALRRTMIAEVPTICIEHVYIWNNTSVIVDEVLSHRLGLIPLNVDPELFEYREDRNTLVFKLSVTCTRKAGANKDSKDLDEVFSNHLVTSGMLEWVPQGEQAQIPLFQTKPPAPTNLNIVLAKLRPNQSIDLECHAVKNVGKEHAKWSPVATATYRLHPHISILSPPPPHQSEAFQRCFTTGVIDVDPKSGQVSVNKQKVRNEQMSREVFRHEEFKECVKLGRIRDWFLFSVESEGPYQPQDIPQAAIQVIRNKIAILRKATETLLHGPEDANDESGPIDTKKELEDVVMMET